MLVESGWQGDAIPGGGARLEALWELDHVREPALPAGDADRVAMVATELARRYLRLNAELELVEPSENWSACWQLVFRSLERGGTRLIRSQPTIPCAPADTDLGRLQRSLHGQPEPASQPVELRGDGSFVVVTADTSWQAARATAAIVACLPAEKTAVVREHDASALDNALATAGFRSRSAPAAAAFGRVISERDGRERVRLLDVAFTRARAHVILAVPLRRTDGSAKAWLDELHDCSGPLLTLPDPRAAEPMLTVPGLSERLNLPVRTSNVSSEEELEVRAAATGPRYWYTRARGNAHGGLEAPPYRITPSLAASDFLALPAARILATTRFTRRMAFTHTAGTSWDAIGTALHAFLAADLPDLSADHRIEIAERVLAHAGLRATFDPDALLAASDALCTYVDSRWPNAKWHREIPISALLPTEHGTRCSIEGTIDLLLETPHGYVIIDHKSFPGRQEHWAERALKYAPLLFTHAIAVRIAGGTVIAMVIHFTVGGGVVEVGDG